MTTRFEFSRGFSVSYRQRWWRRRLYACGNVDGDEAMKLMRTLMSVGYRRLRIEAS